MSGAGDWDLAVRQQYQYDGANVRMPKRTTDGWAKAMSKPGLSAIGRCGEIQLHARRQNKRWLKGQTWARDVFQHVA